MAIAVWPILMLYTSGTRCSDISSQQSQLCNEQVHITLPKESLKYFKHRLWPFRKRRTDLESDEQERLAHLFEHSPLLKQTYDLWEQLTTIFDTARSKAERGKLLRPFPNIV
jgi:YD repeat-containing protein